ncbi:MAG: M56 family metallopeptidase, partial [Oscillospiraceae bacterium]|nr:M56 family metallopeptidase [Oscillospiraceae bacterium]
MTDVIRTLLIMSITGSILALLLFAIKPLARDRLPKSAQYYLWLVVLFTLLVPISMIVVLPDNSPLPAAPVQSVVEQIVVPAAPVIPVPQAQTPAVGATPATGPTQPASLAETILNQAVSAGMIAVLVYALGVLGLLLYYLINYKSYTRLHCRRNRTANAEE